MLDPDIHNKKIRTSSFFLEIFELRMFEDIL